MTVSTQSLQGKLVVDCRGKRIGEVLDVHHDAFSGRPAWLTVRAGLLRRRSLVPLGESAPTDGKVQVPYEARTIRRAPYVDLAVEEEALEDEAEREGEDESIEARSIRRERRGDHWALYEYYGLPFGRPDTVGSASPETVYGFASAGTSPQDQGSRRTRREIAEAYPSEPAANARTEAKR